MRIVLAALATVALALVLVSPLLAKPVPRVYVAQGAAIKGYDPVAYFKENTPVKGSADWRLEWQGATWFFKDAANREAFRKSPDAYAPQYGGYCAYAVSQNSTAGIDPKAFTIREGKLYLNYNLAIQRRWLEKVETYVRDADRNWPQLIAP